MHSRQIIKTSQPVTQFDVESNNIGVCSAPINEMLDQTEGTLQVITYFKTHLLRVFNNLLQIFMAIGVLNLTKHHIAVTMFSWVTPK